MPALIAEGRLTVLDAPLTLRSFMRNGAPDPRLFAATLCEAVGRLCAESKDNLRIYGEMVEILAEEGNLRGAEELEELWNQLGARESFTLLCGYSSAHFAAPNAGKALEEICRKHTRVHQDNADLLGNWLLGAGRQLA